MPRYVEKFLKKCQHFSPFTLQHAPHQWNRPNYGAQIQFATQPDSSPPLNKKKTQHVQSVVGLFLYYGRAIDFTMLVALNKIAAHQAHPTQFFLTKCDQLLNYASTYPNVKLYLKASNMILHMIPML